MTGAVVGLKGASFSPIQAVEIKNAGDTGDDDDDDDGGGSVTFIYYGLGSCQVGVERQRQRAQ